MFRIKTFASSGRVFLSPFVYTKDQAEKLISNLMSWHRTPTYEIVPVRKFPVAANPIDRVRSMSNIRKAEYAWGNFRDRRK